MKNLKENAAQELIDAFKKVGESVSFCADEIERMFEEYEQLLINQMHLDYLRLIVKHDDACWLTRWYWLGKLKKHSEKMKMFYKDLEDESERSN